MFRLGDFYETFDGDAEIAADVLDIVLTRREAGKGLRVPLAGIPYHAADGYIARLIAAGHKVAICEQIGKPTKGKKLVERDVTRVVTPGTVLDPAMLDARTNNYIAAIVIEGNRAGIAHADITTGEFLTTEIMREPGGGPARAGTRVAPPRAAEIVVPTDFNDASPSLRPPGSRKSQPQPHRRLALDGRPRGRAPDAPLRRRVAGRLRRDRQSRSRSAPPAVSCNISKKPSSAASTRSPRLRPTRPAGS